MVPAGFALMTAGGQPANEKLQVGQVAADFRLPDFYGATMTLMEKRGKVILLDFWEVWCGPCLESMPKIDELYVEFRSSGLEVLAC